MFVFNSWKADLVTIFVTFSILVIAYCKWCFQYWQKRNLPYLEPQLPFGNCYRCLSGNENWALTMKRIYNKMKQNGWKHGGIYISISANYMPVNLDYVKNILVKDFQYFTDRGGYHNEEANPLDGNLFSAEFSRWRRIKPRLTPNFTSMKLKAIFPTLLKCKYNLLKAVDKANGPIDVKEVVTNFTLDVLATCAFGLSSLSSEENSLFKRHAGRITHPDASVRLKLALASNFPKLASYFDISAVPKDMTDFYLKTTTDIITDREKNNYRKNDFLQLLIDTKNKSYNEDGLNEPSFTIEDIAAQTFVFAAAGFETSATLMTFALYELAKHPEIQKKVRDEVLNVLGQYDGQLTYEAIQDMKYLNQVIDETLRLYPPLPMINRKCVKDYKIENTIIEKDRIVIIPILGIHYDEEYYPNPLKFDPDRFSEENKASRHKCAYIPFGAGPRTCIGIQFGLMKVKLGLGFLLRSYKFLVNSKTDEPIKFQPNTFVLSAAGGVWLNAERVEE